MAGNILVPMGMDAFCLTTDLADPKHTSRICPVTQPDYTGLRLQDAILQHDILDHVDLHKSQPANFNPRLSDLGSADSATGKHVLRDNRIGTYLHWSLPKYYRSGKQSTDSYVPPTDATGNAGPTTSSPAFPLVPNRWLIIRHLTSHVLPPGQTVTVPEFEGWVVESDRLWNIDDLPDKLGLANFGKGLRSLNPDALGLEDFDLETDVSPLVNPSGNDADTVDSQAEAFIGMKESVDSWSEQNPRAPYVPLTTMTSSNPLFADYTFHNSNVFSIRDNYMFPGKDAKGQDIPVYLSEAVADYVVIGWHSQAQDDPFNAPGGGNFQGTLVSRLPELFMSLTWDTNADTARLQKNDMSSARLLCHSSIYDVHFRRSGSPTTVMADDAGKNFHLDATTEAKMEPLSVGTTPLDALLTYLDAHADDPVGDLTTLSSAIRKLAGLLIAADDGYDSQVKAQDLLYGHNYAESLGGSEWHYDGRAETGQGPPSPSAAETATLASLNSAQAILDATSRELELNRWSLFAQWWNLVADPLVNFDNPKAKHDKYEAEIDPIIARIQVLLRRQTDNQAFITSTTNLDSNGKQIAVIKPQPPYKKTAKSPYYIRKDPTVCIAGMASGWPANFNDTLLCRMESQLIPGPPTLASKVPKDLGNLQALAGKLLGEFLVRPDAKDAVARPGWKLWNDTQPWCPLYVEWEALYIHLERGKWKVETFNSGVPVHEMVRYKIDEDLNADPNNQKDQRILSGRTLVLPQQIFSLKSMVGQIPLTPDTIKTYNLTDDEVTALTNKIDQMQYISCPLSGFTNHLLTMVEGSHVKPLARTSSQTDPVPLLAAINATSFVTAPPSTPLFGSDILSLIKTQSALTPYGNLVGFPLDPSSPAGFKAVTHGQVMFTKFNIIDKFGQAVCAIDPKPIPVHPTFPPPSVYPCISDYCAPGVLSNPNTPPDYLPNVVYRDPVSITRDNTTADPTKPPVPLTTTGQEALSRFFQLNPSINQDTRLNAAFVQPDLAGGKAFVPTKDWENPIWGWVIINFANYGLQFFLPDGTFYTEVRVGGPGGSAENLVRYLPFSIPPAVIGANAQLNSLIISFTQTYLQSFFYMVNQSVDQTPHAPPDYSNYLTSIVGKPLALVNTKWSLELSTPPLQPQQTIGSPLINPSETLDQYNIPIKFGDASRPFDGLVAYWDINSSTGITDFSKIHTYFNDQYPVAKDDPRQPISENSPDGFPTLTPTWIDSSVAFEDANTNFTLKAMLIDPFTPIHAYTPILPIVSLVLPSWTVQAACQKMTAFFHLGPMLITNDVPTKYAAKYQAQQVVDPAVLAKPDPTAPTVSLPISNKALWRWLQPYDTDDQGHHGTIFDSYALVEDDGKPKFAPGPYTMTEGYLQLLQPVTKPNM